MHIFDGFQLGQQEKFPALKDAPGLKVTYTFKVEMKKRIKKTEIILMQSHGSLNFMPQTEHHIWELVYM